MQRTQITVYGGSQPKPGSDPYQEALKLGNLMGKRGWAVLTGGYIGVMEAVSRGAAEAGGHVIGVTCDEIERWRPVNPNPWLHEERRFKTTRERMYALAESCDAALALPGGIGTLAEVAFTWSQLQTGSLDPRPLILVGPAWESLLTHFSGVFEGYIPAKDLQRLGFAANVDEAVAMLVDYFQKSG